MITARTNCMHHPVNASPLYLINPVRNANSLLPLLASLTLWRNVIRNLPQSHLPFAPREIARNVRLQHLRASRSTNSHFHKPYSPRMTCSPFLILPAIPQARQYQNFPLTIMRSFLLSKLSALFILDRMPNQHHLLSRKHPRLHSFHP